MRRGWLQAMRQKEEAEKVDRVSAIGAALRICKEIDADIHRSLGRPPASRLLSRRRTGPVVQGRSRRWGAR